MWIPSRSASLVNGYVGLRWTFPFKPLLGTEEGGSLSCCTATAMSHQEAYQIYRNGGRQRQGMVAASNASVTPASFTLSIAPPALLVVPGMQGIRHGTKCFWQQLPAPSRHVRHVRHVQGLQSPSCLRSPSCLCTYIACMR